MNNQKKLVRIILCMVAIVVMLCVGYISPAYAANTVTIQSQHNSDSPIYLQYNSSGWKDLDTPKHWIEETGEVVYCVQHSRNNPYGRTYEETDATSFLSSATVKGMQIILANGYPINTPSGFTADEARQATANALRFWLSEQGEDYTYNFTNRAARPDAIRAKEGYEHVLEWADELLQMARDNKTLSHKIAITASALKINSAGTYYEGTIKVTLTNINSGYTLSGYPSDAKISGFTGKSSETVTISIPVSYSGKSYTIKAEGKDNRVPGNVKAYAPSSGSYQRVFYSGTTGVAVADASAGIEVPALGHVKLKKASADPSVTNGNSSYSLQGAVYDVFNSSNTKVGTITTDANGEGTLKNLVAGTGYYVKEVTAPKGFVLDESKTTFTITANQTTTVNVKDEPCKGNVKLKKASADPSITNGNSNYSLQGAVYDVFNSSNTKVGTITTDANGEGTLTGLPLGTGYYLKEVTAPKGYVLDESKTTFTITANQTTTVNVKDEPYKGNVKIKKASANTAITNGNSNYSLQGAVYDVYNSSDAKVGRITTNANGEGTLTGLPIGTGYYVKEVTAPKGYKLDSAKTTFAIKANETTTVNVKDEPYTGNVKIKKASANPELTDGNSCYSLEGAVYDVFNSSNAKVGRITTNTNGEGTLTGLPIGTGYYVKEVTAPKGYALDPAKTTFAIQSNKTTTVNLTDKPQNDPNYVLLKKLDSTTGKGVALGDGSLAGAEFTVKYYDGFYSTVSELNGKTAKRTWIFVTDSDGYCDLSNEYLVSGDALYVSSGGDTVFPLGTVTIQETKSPTGYFINDEIYIRQITSDGYMESVNTYNVPEIPEEVKMGKISISKVLDENEEGADGELVPEQGAEFQIYLKSAGSYAASAAEERDLLVTDAEGKATTKDLPYGTYVIHQIKGSEGYFFSKDIEVTISADGQHISRVLNNVRIRAYLNIIKKDAETGETIAFAGITFKLKDAEGNYIVQKVGSQTYDTFTTNAEGLVQLPKTLGTGVYTICELTTTSGYLLGEDLTFNLTADGIVDNVFTVEYKNTPIKGRILIEKVGTVFTGITENDGEKTPVFEEKPLSGVVFDITAAEDIVVGGHLKASKGDVVDTVVTTSGEDWSKLLYLGKYEFSERSTISGYLPTTEIYEAELTEVDTETAIVTDSVEIKNDWQNTSAKLKKEAEFFTLSEDGSTVKTVIEVKAGAGFVFGLYAAQAFTAYGASEPCIVAGDLIARATTDANGELTFDLQVPHGKYYIREIYSDETYVKNDTQYDIDLSYDATKTEIAADIPDVILNKLKTQEITISKKELTGEEAVPGATIEVRNKETGEVVYRGVTDENGELPNILIAPNVEYEYKEILAAETYSLNTSIFTFSVDESGNVTGNTVILNEFNYFELLKTEEDGITPLPGCTFAVFDEAGEKLMDAVSDENGIVRFEKLPFGVLTIKELDTVPGYQTSDITITLDVDGTWVNADQPTLFTNNEIRIGTYAAAADGTKEIKASAAAEVIDTVSYENINVGREYTIKGVLMDNETGEPIIENDAPVTAETKFVPDKANGTVEVKFTFNTGLVAGKQLVVFETMYDGNAEVASHTDIEDEEQTITVLVPEIRTKATSADGEKVITAASSVQIVDTVSFKNLTVGKEYTVTGTLMSKETGEPIIENDAPVTAETTFTAETTDGEVQVIFTVDSRAFAGKQIIVFESLYEDGFELAVHTDIEDEEQTVTVLVPEICTKATSADGEKAITAASSVQIVDTVSFKNLTIGKEYTVTGTLMSKETGESIMESDAPVTAETTFTAETIDGEVQVIFTVDSRAFAGKEIVVFESLSEDGFELAVHADIEDEEQTVAVLVPEIVTKATSADGEKAITAASSVQIVDNVSFKNLTVGKEYTVTGTLMSKETGEPIMENDAPVTAETTFTAEATDGEVQVIFTVDSRAFAGKEIVVFESLSEDGFELAVHADIEDEEQTVAVLVPEIRTKATSVDGEKIITAASSVQIVDTVSFKNLTVGKEYTVTGTLMSKETGEPIMENDAPVTAETTFTAEVTDGEIEVVFTLNSFALVGKQIVVFESLSEDGFELAVHTDIEDEEQTVTVLVPEISTKAASWIGFKTISASKNAKVYDTVSYTNLTAGKEYTIKGILMDKETNTPVIINGETVTAEKVFVPRRKDGTVKVKFAFDASALGGKQIVIFETLYESGTVVAAHEDIADAEQTVKIAAPPEIPSTGDLSNPLLWGIIAAVSLGISIGCAVVIMRRRKKDE